jgi:DNA invertase Pin-like site-specific DNA recombinase
MNKKPTLDELAEQLKALKGASKDESYAKFILDVQNGIEDALEDLMAKRPSREGRGHVFFYGRQSKDDKDQKHTEAGQTFEFEEYYNRKLSDLEKRWPPFFDKNISGGVPLFRRPAGSRINEFIKRGDHLVITKLDRAFRSGLDGWRTVQSFERRGVAVHIINMGLDMSTPIGRLTFTILLAHAQFEREITSVRTKEGQAAWRRLGGVRAKWFVPIGWKYTGKLPNRKLVPDPVSRAFAEYCMEQLAKHGTIRKVTALLKYEGCVNPKTGRPYDRNGIRQQLLARALDYPRTDRDGLNAEAKKRKLKFGEHVIPGRREDGKFGVVLLRTFLGEPQNGSESAAPEDGKAAPEAPGAGQPDTTEPPAAESAA